MAYSLDVYLRRAKPADSLLDFALFVTFFPQLVAGPIVRPTQLIPQFQEPVRANRTQLLWGLGLMTLGLFEKMVIADGALAPAADAVFGAEKAVPFADAWIGTLAFAGQIFSDFAGYSTVAIGAGAVSRLLAARQLPLSRTRRSGSPTSGAGGTSRSPRGCATTCTSRSAGTGRAGTARRPT